MLNEATIRKELQAIRALAAEMVKRTSRLEEEQSPVKEKAPRKGKKMSLADERVARRNRFLDKKSAR